MGHRRVGRSRPPLVPTDAVGRRCDPPSRRRPWVPVGTTGVVRRAERDPHIVAEREVEVVMIPAARAAASWFRPYSPEELAAVLARTASSPRAPPSQRGERDPAEQLPVRC